ncbi:O-antigen ligase family protein [Butyrivibrio sp. NC2002]|uniref:O-antigen ligase family protein n=1 Tax=Butyrivibrio sp. NC2002 TaxID=1410610 RepID=UPI0005631EDD|nr:O-antigen ligase family protein [Butyrivibrio sp. NC2002]
MNLSTHNFNNIWKDYLTWGFAFSILLSLVDYSHDFYSQIILFAVFFIITGFTTNMVILGDFLRKYYLLSVAAFLWFIFFFLHPTEPLSYRMPIISFFIIFAGYRLSIESTESVSEAFRKLIVLIVASIIIAIFWHRNGVNGITNYFPTAQNYFQSYYSRLTGVYMQPMPAATVILFFTIISVYLINDKLLKFLSLLVGFYALWLTSTRSAILICIIGLVLYVIREKLNNKTNKAIGLSSSDKLVAVGFFFCIAVILFFMRNAIISTLSGTIQRFANFNTTTDIGNQYRKIAWEETITGFLQAPIVNKFLGHGVLGAYYRRPVFDSRIAILNGNPSTPVENTFLSILFDFGLIGFLLYVVAGIFAIICFIKCSDYIKRGYSLALLAIMAESFTYDMEYWNNVSFLLFFMIGIVLGIREESKPISKEKSKQIQISATIGLLLCWIPKMCGFNITCSPDESIKRLEGKGIAASYLSSVIKNIVIAHADKVETSDPNLIAKLSARVI